jgi:outer membrane usher protein
VSELETALLELNIQLNVRPEALPLADEATSAPTDEDTLPIGEPIPVELRLNQVLRGDFPMVLQEGGDVLLRGQDLDEIGVAAPYGTPVPIGGDAFFSLRDLGATHVAFDADRLALHAELPATRLPKQVFDFQRRQPDRVLYPTDSSAYFNYRLHHSGDDAGGAESWLAGGELGIRHGDLLFRTESAYLRHDQASQTIRYGTNITHDNRETLQRWIVGDFAASSGDLGRVLSVGGISVSKTYSINPYFVYQPMAGFVSTITTPSEVEIYLDDLRLRTETVAPGEFEVSNIHYYGGRRDLEMVIRDGFGREERLAYPYYFSEQNLRQGLHDYSYNAGRLRTGVGTYSDEYGDWAVSGYHRYGLSDVLTVGVRGEGASGVVNLGPTSVLRMNRWGILSGAIAGSRAEDGAGWAASAGYAFRQQGFHLQGNWRRYSPDYEVVGRLAEGDRPEQEIMVATGYGVGGFGNLGLSVQRLTQHQGTDRKVVSLSYSRTINRRLRLMALASHSEATERANSFYVGLSYHPGHSLGASLRHRHTEDGYSDTFEIGKATPVGEGLGYRLSADRTVIGDSEQVRLAPWAQYNGRYGIYTANVQSESQAGGATRTAYRLGLSGGIGYVADTVRFSRPINDSFALVDVGGLEGVRVYHSSREIDRTDKNGQAFLPDLGSYRVNRISIEDRDIPMDYAITTSAVQASPPLRSGSLIRFEVERYQAYTGRLRVKADSQWQFAEFVELSVQRDGTSVTVPTGRDGEFYLENLPPGRYSAAFAYRGASCEFALNIPESTETIADLGDLNGCEMAQ